MGTRPLRPPPARRPRRPGRTLTLEPLEDRCLLSTLQAISLPPGQAATGDSFTAAVSADGRYTVFTSTATNLVRNQLTNDNGDQNVFLYDKQTGAITLVNHLPGQPAATGDAGLGTLGDRPPDYLVPTISADGGTVAFASFDDDLVANEATPPGTPGPLLSVYLYDVASGNVALVNHTDHDHPATIGNQAFHPVLSAGGRYVALGLVAPGVSAFDTGAVALYDRAADTTTFLTPASYLNGGTASDPVLSDDGRFVAYVDQGNVYLFDRQGDGGLGSTALVSHTAASLTTPADDVSGPAVLSADGNAVAFVSRATDLVANQSASGASGFTNVFVYHNDGSGAVTLVSGVNGSTLVTGDGDSDSPAIDHDGDHVAYRSDATNLINGTVSGSNVYEYDSKARTQTLVSHKAGSATTSAAGDSSDPVIDEDGHLVAYVSRATDLNPGQGGTPGLENVFLWLRQTDANILASGAGGSQTVTGNANSDSPLLARSASAAYGSLPLFSSRATNLVNGVGPASVVYLNRLVQLSLTPNVVLDATPAGSLVGTLSVTSLLAGQFLPPTYRLVPGQGNDAAFLLGGDGLFTQFLASYAGQQTYQVVVHVNVGFGDDAVTVQVVVSPVHFPVRAITAELFLKRAGRRKPARLAVRVRYADTGMEKEEFLSPFQRPAYRNIRVSVRDGNGDGVPDQVVLTARKGRRTFRMTVTA